MRKTRLLSILLFSAVFLSTSSFAGHWVDARRGFIPFNAWYLGRDTDGQRLALCRAGHRKSVMPGKIRQGFRGCHIAYGGREIIKHHYQVYVDRRRRPRGFWVNRRFGRVPRRAWVVGYDTNGASLYLCRGRYHGLQIGKVRPGIGGCDIPYAGRGVHLDRYQVFIKHKRRD